MRCKPQDAGARAALVLVAALTLSAVALAGDAARIAIKASAAQWLMRGAFGDAAQTVRKPWPWADFRPIARLSVPRLDIAQFVLDGAHGEALAFGPGWVPGSSRPGQPGNIALAGHRDTHFSFLADLRDGDRMALRLPGGRDRHYRVTRRYIADQHDVAAIDPGHDDRLTLITCYPFDAVTPGGPQRFIVEAQPLRRGGDVTL